MYIPRIWAGALAMLLCSAAVAAETPSKTLTVTGRSTLSVMPDTARVQYGVVTVATSLDEARSSNAVAARRVTDALKALKLPESKTTTRSDGTLQTTTGLAVRTGDVRVELIYDEPRTPTRLPSVLGFRVVNSSVARYHDDDPGKLSATAARIFDTVLKAGANQVGGVEFSLRDEAAAQERALAAAVANARRRAELLAREGRVRIQGVRSISETDYGFPREALSNQAGFAGGEADVATPLQAGALLYHGSVTVVYDLE